jgi:hypothetical protein
MVDRNDSFLREVNEEIRRDQLKRVWQKYGVIIVVGIAALFVGIGAFQWNKARQISSEEKSGARFEAASQLAAAKKTDEALKAFEAIANDSPAGYRSLARLRVASEHANGGRAAEALAAYEALAGDTGADDILRDFAAMQAALLRLDQADWTEMKNRLTPLTEDKRPWRAMARETLGLAAFKTGQTEEATKIFEQILGDPAATSGMSRRAQEMLAVLTDAASAKGASRNEAPAGPAAPVKDGAPAATK